jgi:hypothetical protein
MTYRWFINTENTFNNIVLSNQSNNAMLISNLKEIKMHTLTIPDPLSHTKG